MSYKRIKNSINKAKLKYTTNEQYKNNTKKFTRKRKMNFEDYIWYLTMQKGRTTSMELDEYLKNKNETYEISISKQAFSKQRQYMSPQIFIDMYKDYLMDFYNNYPEEVKLYKGYYVLGIDGTTVEIPNTEGLRIAYKSRKNKYGKMDAARAKVSGIYDLENEFMIDAIITDCTQGEKKLAKENIDKAGEILDLSKCLLIFDRGYPGIDLIWKLEKRGIKYIFRLNGMMYLKEKKLMKTNDEVMDLELNTTRLKKIHDKDLKEELKNVKKLKTRFIKVELDSNEIEYLISNVPQEIITEEEMKEAYFKRWKIEIGYDILKNKLHIENFTGKTKMTIEQDFYAQIYTFNVLQDIKKENNANIQKKQKDKELRYEYKVNVNILAGWLKNLFIAIIFAENDEKREKLYDILIEKAEKNLIAVKPNRSYKREKNKHIKNKYTINLRNNM